MASYGRYDTKASGKALVAGGGGSSFGSLVLPARLADAPTPLPFPWTVRLLPSKDVRCGAPGGCVVVLWSVCG